jgi:hypothetical protein
MDNPLDKVSTKFDCETYMVSVSGDSNTEDKHLDEPTINLPVKAADVITALNQFLLLSIVKWRIVVPCGSL